MMSARVPTIEVRAPDGRESTVVELRGERLSVGRGAVGSEPDLVLGPDPQNWVSRVHCMFELDAGAWWLSDNASKNGTLVRRGEEGEPELVEGRVRLASHDVILILGAMTEEEGEPLYWRLAFSDPDETVRPDGVEVGQGELSAAEKMCLEYDWAQAKAYRRREGARRTEVVGLRPKAHQLVRFMADKSRKSAGGPVVCEHEELIRALWGEPEEWPKYRSYTREDLTDLVADARKAIEPERGNPRLLETVPKIGYRLNVCEGRS